MLLDIDIRVLVGRDEAGRATKKVQYRKLVHIQFGDVNAPKVHEEWTDWQDATEFLSNEVFMR